MTRTPLALCLVMLFAGGASAAAQPVQLKINVAHVTLDQSAVPLYGPWKFTVGDSPIDPKTGKPLWAEPGFDDSKWETVDLTPKEGVINPIMGLAGYGPGWTAKGHPGYFGYAWYRIRVQVQAWPGEALALAGPADVDDAYQLFDNGELAGHFGDFIGSKPTTYYRQPKMFPLAQQGSHGLATGQDRADQDGTGSSETSAGASTRVLAFRVWMPPEYLVFAPDSGGMHSAPVLGDAVAVAAGYQMRWLEVIRAYASLAAQALLFGLLAAMAFSLILFDRSDRVYLWMGALFLLIAVDVTLVVIGPWTELLSFLIYRLLVNCFMIPPILAAWVMVWWVWFGLQRPRWLPRLTAVLMLLFMVSNILGYEIFFGLVPHEFAVHFLTVSLVLRLLLFALLLRVVVEGIRRQGVEGWLVLPLAVLREIVAFTGQLNYRMNWFTSGTVVTISTINALPIAVVITVLLLRRLLQSVKRQRLMALDVKQAQEVQQVFLPEAHMTLPGLAIESVYRPAREVGGDFFQIIPHKSDGSVQIVAGDVTGKGLQAGMLVALLVGAIRSIAQFDPDPVVMLWPLNQRLMGRGDAQATCLALCIEADGAAKLANAGHVAPYVNGEELPMEGALPLGMFEGAESSVMHFKLKDGDRLVLMSDGIAEAMDTSGKLFGFERVHELLRTATTAAEVANAAQAFGQEDDISVISVTRTAVAELSAA